MSPEPQVTPRFKEPKPSKREQAKTKAAYVSTMKEAMWRRILERDGGCLLHGMPWAPSGEVAPCSEVLTPHHRRKASSLGAYSFENLVVLCSFHNGDIENHEDWVRDHYRWYIVREEDEEWPRLGRRGWRG